MDAVDGHEAWNQPNIGWMDGCTGNTVDILNDDGTKVPWQEGAEKPYLQVDLGSPTQVTSMKATNYREGTSRRTRSWSLQVSLDGAQFSKVAEGDGTDLDVFETSFAEVVAQFVRFVIEDPPQGGDKCQGLMELGLYGVGPKVAKVASGNAHTAMLLDDGRVSSATIMQRSACGRIQPYAVDHLH